MQLVSKEKALSLIEKCIDEVTSIKSLSSEDFDAFTTWVRNVKTRIDAIFGAESPQASELYPLLETVLKEKQYTSNRKEYSRPILAILRALKNEIEELWSDTGTQAPSTLDNLTDSHLPLSPTNNKVFIVHGHDHGRMQAVARFLEHLELEPIILHERPNSGNTIIEKFETNSDVAYALVLLTPDDIGSTVSDRGNLRPRARQNVILELGYFLAKLGRRRTAALIAQGVEIPSDYSGIVYISIDNDNEWKFLLARELKDAGLSVDMNKAI